jgi:divalent metal cation (Fe/Co/Zn/Cd) transporter
VLAIAAVMARSVALAGFGLDSLIEAGASTVVIWELSGTGEERQRRGLWLIGAMIIPRTWQLLRQASDVLLEATPKDVDLGKVRRHMLKTPGVIDVHDLHAWTITSGVNVLSAHVVVSAEGLGGPVLDELGGCLADHFDIEHSTFQIEPPGHRDHEPILHR